MTFTFMFRICLQKKYASTRASLTSCVFIVGGICGRGVAVVECGCVVCKEKKRERRRERERERERVG